MAVSLTVLGGEKRSCLRARVHKKCKDSVTARRKKLHIKMWVFWEKIGAESEGRDDQLGERNLDIPVTTTLRHRKPEIEL